MKKNKHLVLGMATLALTFMVLAGCSKSGGGRGGIAALASDFSYELTANGAGIKITDYTSKGGTLIIPATIEDMPVTEIGNWAFNGSNRNTPNNCDTITSVVVPDSVTVIGDNAFMGIDELTKATLPDGLKEIPDALFMDCGKLTSVNLPASLESIGNSAFWACGELTELTIPASLTSVKFMDGNFGLLDAKENTNNLAFVSCDKLPIKTQQIYRSLGLH